MYRPPEIASSHEIGPSSEIGPGLWRRLALAGGLVYCRGVVTPVDKAPMPRPPADCPIELPVSRRSFVMLGAGILLGGCANSTTQRAGAVALPPPPWDHRGAAPGSPPPAISDPPVIRTTTGFAQVRPRSSWAGGRPVATLMNQMTPITAITVHHDAMQFTGTTDLDSKSRLEAIRRGHRREQWGDIGYHFAIDRRGVIWEGRPLGWQGAHVKNRNEGNVGIMLFGNFEHQRPSTAQLAALHRHVIAVRKRYKIVSRKVLTHREWPGAQTLCPGRSLQSHMVDARRRKAFG